MEITYKDLGDIERENYNTAYEILIESNDPTNLSGIYIDPDTLQMVLEEVGMRKSRRIYNKHWYNNLVSHAGGYIAELLAVNQKGWLYRFIINNIGTEPLIEGVQYIECEDKIDFTNECPYCGSEEIDCVDWPLIEQEIWVCNNCNGKFDVVVEMNRFLKVDKNLKYAGDKYDR